MSNRSNHGWQMHIYAPVKSTIRSTVSFYVKRGLIAPDVSSEDGRQTRQTYTLELRPETELLAHPSKDRDRSDREDRRKD
jgi:hypothetical protein